MIEAGSRCAASSASNAHAPAATMRAPPAREGHQEAFALAM
jgi:hypothetical protein